jgi:hypothetical protein
MSGMLAMTRLVPLLMKPVVLGWLLFLIAALGLALMMPTFT